MSNKIFTVYRNTTFNGNLLESKQPLGFFHTYADAEAKAEALYASVEKSVALRGFCFSFFVCEETVC